MVEGVDPRPPTEEGPRKGRWKTGPLGIRDLLPKTPDSSLRYLAQEERGGVSSL